MYTEYLVISTSPFPLTPSRHPSQHVLSLLGVGGSPPCQVNVACWVLAASCACLVQVTMLCSEDSILQYFLHPAALLFFFFQDVAAPCWGLIEMLDLELGIQQSFVLSTLTSCESLHYLLLRAEEALLVKAEV